MNDVPKIAHDEFRTKLDRLTIMVLEQENLNSKNEIDFSKIFPKSNEGSMDYKYFYTNDP